MASLQVDEVNQLKKFRLGESGHNSPSVIPLETILNHEQLIRFINELEIKTHSPDHKVAASMFTKRYGFFAALTLYAMTILNKQLDTSISNISLEIEDNNDIWLPKFQFEKLDGIRCPTSETRELWRDKTIKSIFAEHIYLIINCVSKETKISKFILWENIAIYIFWFYERLLDDPTLNNKKAIIQDDFDYVVQHAKGELFGPYNRNPLARYFHEKTLHPETGQEVRIRSTCCLFYKTTVNGDRCNTCPIGC